MKYNKNELAKIIAKYEGKKEQVNIAQIKEVLRCVSTLIISDIKWLAVLLRK